MAGNTAVLKHASNVSGCALAIEEIFKTAGFPQNVFRTLLTSGKDIDEVVKRLEWILYGTIAVQEDNLAQRNYPFPYAAGVFNSNEDPEDPDELPLGLDLETDMDDDMRSASSQTTSSFLPCQLQLLDSGIEESLDDSDIFKPQCRAYTGSFQVNLFANFDHDGQNRAQLVHEMARSA
jgi:hypothetical protein